MDAIALQPTPAAARSARARAFSRARRHSGLVRMLRVAIPLGSAAAGAALLFAFAMARIETEARGPAAEAGNVRDGRITMEDPRLKGFRSDARPYSVDAENAVQHVRTPDLIELARPVANVETQSDGRADIRAADGLYDGKSEHLDLRRDVRIVTESGYDLNLSSAKVDLQRGALQSEEAVTVTMTDGSISAANIDLTDSGGTIRFRGGVSSTFNNVFPAPEGGAAAAPPPNE
jgi:lipopolysaccharide export system protein LptC